MCILRASYQEVYEVGLSHFGDVNFDYLGDICKVIYCKVTIFPLLLFCRRCFEILCIDVLFLIKLSSSNLASIDDS